LTVCQSHDSIGAEVRRGHNRLIYRSWIWEIYSASKAGGWLICGSPYLPRQPNSV